MIKYLFMIILGILPIFSWIFQKYYSKKSNRFKLLLKHWTIRYDDFILIGFNIFIPFWLNIKFETLILIILICSLIQILFHFFWANCNKKNNLIHMFDKNSSKINGAGITHLVFSIIEMTFMTLWFISNNYNIYFLISGIFLLIFTFLMYIGGHKTNGKLTFIDFLFVTILLILVIIKLIFYLI